MEKSAIVLQEILQFVPQNSLFGVVIYGCMWYNIDVIKKITTEKTTTDKPLNGGKRYSK